MTSINPLKFGVMNGYFKPVNNDEQPKKEAKQEKPGENQNKQLGSNEVLGFLAAQNADIVPVKTQKTLDVSKYVSPEQEARIAESMKGFESHFDEAYAAAVKEFPEISSAAAGNIALAYINSINE